MNAQDRYKSLLDDFVWPTLRPLGFKRSGPNFGLRGAGVWGVINFQKDRSSKPDWVSFTMNLGVRSDVLARSELCGSVSPCSETRVPSVSHCDWRTRIGEFLCSKNDVWWEIATGDGKEIGPEIRGVLLEHGVPALRARRSDQALLELACVGAMEGVALALHYGGDREFQARAADALREAKGARCEAAWRRMLERRGYRGS